MTDYKGSLQKKVWIFSTSPRPPPPSPKVWKISGDFTAGKGKNEQKSAKGALKKSVDLAQTTP